MCPECNGIGRVVRLDHGVFFDRTKSLNEGAILHRDFAVDSLVLAHLRAVRPGSTTTSPCAKLCAAPGSHTGAHLARHVTA